MSHPFQCYGEIIHQKEAWKEAVEVVLSNADRINALYQSIRPDQIIFAGCTSPFYAGESISAVWQSILGVNTRAVPCSELLLFPEAHYVKGSSPMLVVLSRSGKTTEALWAVEDFERRYPGHSLLIGCSDDSPLTRLVAMSLMLPRAFDVTLPQTKSFSSMYLAAALTGMILGKQGEQINILESAPLEVDGIVQRTEGEIKNQIQGGDFDRIIYLGSGPMFGIAREATLKIMEMSFSNAFCFSFLESRHGPRSLIDERTLVIGLYSRGGLGYEARVMEEYTRDLGATTIAVVPEKNWNSGEVTQVISVDQCWPDGFLGLAYAPVIQLIAYYRAVKLGANPDISKNTTAFIEIQ